MSFVQNVQSKMYYSVCFGLRAPSQTETIQLPSVSILSVCVVCVCVCVCVLCVCMCVCVCLVCCVVLCCVVQGSRGCQCTRVFTFSDQSACVVTEHFAGPKVPQQQKQVMWQNVQVMYADGGASDHHVHVLATRGCYSISWLSCKLAQDNNILPARHTN